MREVFFAGRLTPEKGVRDLIRAMSLVHGDWQLTVAGDGEERGPCEALAADLGISKKVGFVGWLGPEAVSHCMDLCTCVAVPSLWPEPFGRTGPEAFAHGKPVVAYRVGGIPSWLDHGKTGYLVAPGDVEGLANAIGQLLDQPGQRHELGENARQMAFSRWSLHAHIAELVAIFSQVTGIRCGNGE
ncbi:MAG: glycosyltransferase [Anaerolineae bacterium]